MSNTNKVTQWAIDCLNAEGHTVWRNNNLAVKGRKFIGRKGVPDIVGYDKNGLAVYCEVKTGKDKLSEEQIEFLTHASGRGCRTFIASEKDNHYKIQTFDNYYTQRM